MDSQLAKIFAEIDRERLTTNLREALYSVGMNHGFYPLTERFNEVIDVGYFNRCVERYSVSGDTA